MKSRIGIAVVCIIVALGLSRPGFAGSVSSDYPVVFVHGMAGFNNILGFDYWGDDYGNFVGNPYVNWWLSFSQKCFVASLTPFQSSEYRGWQLANEIEDYMATTGSAYVNIIAHSQGGLDARKAARLLRERKGYPVVKVLCSISSPHRGTPLAKYALDMNPTLSDLLAFLAGIYGDIVYGAGNDVYASVKQMVYNDYDPNDGVITGMKVFNQAYPVSSDYASRYVSFITAQDGLSVNPVLYAVKYGFYNIDGDGYCSDDCNNDGAAGSGDGDVEDCDDDGLVGINSQQMGYRLAYHERWWGFDYITTDLDRGSVSDINHPNSVQMTSHNSVLNQDHLDVIGIGPDTFDEMEFYAALIDYIDYWEDY